MTDLDIRALARALEDERKPVNRIALAALIVTLILNMSALIWGAATLSATVNFNGRLGEQTARELARVADNLNDLEARVRVLESSYGRQTP